MDNLMCKLDGVNIRILNAEEFSRSDLANIFEKKESSVPNPLISNIQIAEKDGKIVGLAVLQPQYHAEPIFVDREFADTDLHKRLIESMFELVQPIKGLKIYVFSPSEKIAHLAVRFGFKYLNYEVFVKEF